MSVQDDGKRQTRVNQASLNGPHQGRLVTTGPHISSLRLTARHSLFMATSQ